MDPATAVPARARWIAALAGFAFLAVAAFAIRHDVKRAQELKRVAAEEAAQLNSAPLRNVRVEQAPGSSFPRLVNSTGGILVQRLRLYSTVSSSKWLVAVEEDAGTGLDRCVVVDKDRGSLHAIVPMEGRPMLGGARWRPDGEALAFLILEDAGRGSVGLIDLAAKKGALQTEAVGVERLIEAGHRGFLLPADAWEPGGRALAVLSGRSLDDPAFAGTVLYRVALSRPVDVVEVVRSNEPLHEARVAWADGKVRIEE